MSPWGHQAGVLHAISPISMKLYQFKGSTPQNQKDKLVSDLDLSGDKPPPSFTRFLPGKLFQNRQNVQSSQYNCI